jgi:lysyl-tRNA synthetase class 2
MTSEDRLQPWWAPNRFFDRRPLLRQRAAITRAVRDFFAAEGFVEVETAILQVSPGNETHLHAPQVTLRDSAGNARTRYLRTSPEFACKKLLAAGEPRIFELARVFRDRESGPLHLGEFTMLEWYRAGEPYDRIIADSLAVIACAAKTANTKQFSYRGSVCDPFLDAERVSVSDAFARFAAIDLLATIVDGAPDRARLAEAASRSDIGVTDDDTWSDIFSKVLVERVEPRLGQGRLTVLDEYPAVEAALARLKSADARVAERFEIYACGVELANGFGELTESDEQRRRFTQAMDEKERRYGERYPLDEDFLDALAVMPQASGVALGFDRLVMLASGALRVDQVIWTPSS